MLNVTNHALLSSRNRWARVLSIVGMAGLIAGLFLTSRSYLLSWLFLLIGLLAASIGANIANLYVRDPRSEEVLDRALRGFDDRHVLYNFSLPIPHIFLTPAGPWIMEVVKHRGKIKYDGRKWRRNFTIGRVFGVFSETRLGNPAKDLQKDIDLLRQELSEVMEQEVPVYGAVVFTDPAVELDADSAPLPVVRIDALKEWLRRELKSQTNVPTQMRRRLQETLDEWAN